MSGAIRDVALPQVAVGTVSRHRVALLAFTLTSFVGSALLFLVQPMVARLLLPAAGGSASLWSTAMVFFQVTLLGGYLWAHFTTSKLGVSRHRGLHLVLLALPLLVLPLAVPGGWSLDADRPILDTLWVLGVMVGLPFFALSTASPTLQRWFSETGHPHAQDPYFLYAAGNVGSIGALLGYPLIIEPRLGLGAQTTLFTVGYATLLGLTAACAFFVHAPSATTSALRAASSATAGQAAASTMAWARRARWVTFGAVPSALLLGVTRHLATDVASFPLLWAVPLTLYLLTFVVAFQPGSERWLAPVNMAVLLLAVALPLSFLGLPLVPTVALHCLWFFLAALLSHLRLAKDRPDVNHLTEFYAWLSVGGALGGATVALAAPLLFDRVWEYPLAIVAAIALALPVRALPTRGRGVAIVLGITIVSLLAAGAWTQSQGEHQLTAAALGLAAALGYLAVGHPKVMAPIAAATLIVLVAVGPTNAIFRDRSFFGTYEVLTYPDRTELVMGTTIHGRDLNDSPGHATSYYHPAGPLGSAFDQMDADASWHAGVVGLGVGEIAAYGRTGDQVTFFEIDPVVADIANNEEWFGHLARAEADVAIEIGDGRLLVEASEDTYDLLVVDAFSSDSIPVHLLTKEAVASYLDHVGSGAIMIHISNRHFDLAPVLGQISKDLGANAYLWHFDPAAADRETGASSTRWVAITAKDSTFTFDGPWDPAPAHGRTWTDDFSDLLATLK